MEWENDAMKRKAAILWLLALLPVCRMNALDYVVQKNDTLWGIARKNGGSVEVITRLNQLYGVPLRTGQKLLIPTGILHYTVASGDTVSGIATRNHSRTAWIILYNNLAHEVLKPGQKLDLPVEGGSVAAPTNEMPADMEQVLPAEKWTEHHVTAGETLSSIARKYGVAVEEIRNWNQKKDGKIFPGEVLRIEAHGEKSTDAKESAYPRVPDTVLSVRTNHPAVDSGKYLFATNDRPLSVHVDRKSPTNREETLRFPFDRAVIRDNEATSRGMNFRLNGACRIFAMASGEVQWAGQIRGYNNVVILSHPGGLTTIYGFLVDMEVTQGAKVNAGDEVGKTGWLSYLDGARFYMEIRQDGTDCKPEKIFPFLRPSSMLARKDD
jgi:LysM repeat protein